jgi:hypothetical protein
VEHRPAELDPEVSGIGGLKVGRFRQHPEGRFDPYGQRTANNLQNRQYQPQSSDWQAVVLLLTRQAFESLQPLHR